MLSPFYHLLFSRFTQPIVALVAVSFWFPNTGARRGNNPLQMPRNGPYHGGPKSVLFLQPHFQNVYRIIALESSVLLRIVATVDIVDNRCSHPINHQRNKKIINNVNDNSSLERVTPSRAIIINDRYTKSNDRY